MAAVDPVVLAAGTVREVAKNEFIDRSTGTVENRGRKVTLLTREGFLVFNAPTASNDVVFEAGAPAAVWLRYREWEMNGRRGVTLVFDQVASPEVAAAVVGELQGAGAGRSR